MIPTHYVLALSAILFSIGIVGVLIKRNLIVVLMCIELMLNSVNMNLIVFARDLSSLSGQVFSIFTMTVAAAEGAIGLAIIIALFRNKKTLSIDEINLMKW